MFWRVEGGNRGGSLVCTRHLHNHGVDLQVWLPADPTKLSPGALRQLRILEAMNVPVEVSSGEPELPGADLIIDALIGYSLKGNPRGGEAALIIAASGHRAPVLALDVPSGVDTTTDRVYRPALRADATLTLALPKTGLGEKEARGLVGELYLADIGVTPPLYDQPSLCIVVSHLFATFEILSRR